MSIETLPPEPTEMTQRRRRGRPLEMSQATVLERIRDRGLSGQLFRVHLDEPALYARARRMFGTWAAALAAAGLNYRAAMDDARRRSHEARRLRRV